MLTVFEPTGSTELSDQPVVVARATPIRLPENGTRIPSVERSGAKVDQRG
jgi:hypothetical protein